MKTVIRSKIDTELSLYSLATFLFDLWKPLEPHMHN